MKRSLGISVILLKRSLVVPILLLSSISLPYSLRTTFLSLLAILWNSAFRWLYLSFSTLPFTSLFSDICKSSSDNQFAFLYFFFLGMVLTHCGPLQWTLHVAIALCCYLSCLFHFLPSRRKKVHCFIGLALQFPFSSLWRKHACCL